MSTTTQTSPERTSEAADLVARWAAEEPQTLVSRKLVIDRLLDLRNCVADVVTVDIDAILADIPGVTVVEGRWWEQQLTMLASLLETPETGTA